MACAISTQSRRRRPISQPRSLGEAPQARCIPGPEHCVYSPPQGPILLPASRDDPPEANPGPRGGPPLEKAPCVGEQHAALQGRNLIHGELCRRGREFMLHPSSALRFAAYDFAWVPDDFAWVPDPGAIALRACGRKSPGFSNGAENWVCEGRTRSGVAGIL